MRIRLRGPKGALTLTLPDDATIADLTKEVCMHMSLSVFDVKHGYPPKSLDLARRDPSESLSQLGVKLDGEQLIISPGRRETGHAVNNSGRETDTEQKHHDPKPLEAPISLTKRGLNEVPEVPMPDRGATVVLRIMPNDNSCLFRAIGSAVLPGDDKSMPELRSLVASIIQAQREIYTEVVLEKSPDDYCRWIQTPDAWGGAIELGILATHFEIEICSIDVESLRIDRFNEGQATRCILVYSGIHYDCIALSPSYPPHYESLSSPEMDQLVWDSRDHEILTKSMEICRILQAKHYYTSTRSICLKCNICGQAFTGELEAAKHAQQSGHSDMSEVN